MGEGRGEGSEPQADLEDRRTGSVVAWGQRGAPGGCPAGGLVWLEALAGDEGGGGQEAWRQRAW